MRNTLAELFLLSITCTMTLVTNCSAQEVDNREKAIDAKVEESSKKVEPIEAFNECLVKAMRGNAAAQVELANYYLEGDVVNKDCWKAVYWLEKAAELSNSDAQFILGVFFKDGPYEERSFAKAWKWLTIASRKGDAAAKQHFVELKAQLSQFDEKTICNELSQYEQDQVEERVARNIPKLKKEADNGSAEAQCMLGEIFTQLHKKGLEKTIPLFEKASAQGNLYGKIFLANSYLYGYGVKQDKGKAIALFTEAANENFPVAQRMLGGIYIEQGKYQQALDCFKKAAEQGDTQSLHSLGVMHHDGKLRKDLRAAFQYYQQAALNGNSDAQNNLCNMYLHGHGTDKNFEKAMEWCQQSAIGGCPLAQLLLGTYYSEMQCGDAHAHEKALNWLTRAEANGCNRAGEFIKKVRKDKRAASKKKAPSMDAELIRGISIPGEQKKNGLEEYFEVTHFTADEAAQSSDPFMRHHAEKYKGFGMTTIQVKNLPRQKKYKITCERTVDLDWSCADQEFTVLKNGKVLGRDMKEMENLCIYLSGIGYLPGEKVTYTCTSSDKSFKKTFSVIPNPIIAVNEDKTAMVYAELVCPYECLYFINYFGFEPNEEVTFTSVSNDEEMTLTFRDASKLQQGFMPTTVDSLGGETKVTVTRKSGEKFSLSIPWGISMLKWIK